MYIAIRKSTGEVAMYSDNELNVDTKIFKVKQVNPTEAQLEKIKNNWKLYYRNNKFEFERNAIQEKEDKALNVKELKQQLKDATTVDELKIILKSIFDNL